MQTKHQAFIKLKAYVANILKRLGCELGGLKIVGGENDIFAKSLAITDRNGKCLVELGLVAKKLLAQLDMEQEVYYTEINSTLLMKKIKKNVSSSAKSSEFPCCKSRPCVCSLISLY